METQATHLADFLQLATAAHRGTSFSPEKRGEQYVTEYEKLLAADLAKIAQADDETKAQYISRFKKFLGAYLSSKSRIVSPMISGPANFPARRMEKYRNWERSSYERFDNFREKALHGITTRIKRENQEEKTFLSEIDRYTAELDSLTKNHELMKEGNKRIKAAHKSGEDLTAYLTETFNIQPHMIDWMMKFGFHLSNNLANIKRVEDRIKILQKKEVNASTIGTDEKDFEGGKVVLNHEADRLQIIFDEKPQPEKIAELKKCGFKWSPTNTAWQRQLTPNAKWATNRFLGVQIV